MENMVVNISIWRTRIFELIIHNRKQTNKRVKSTIYNAPPVDVLELNKSVTIGPRKKAVGSPITLAKIIALWILCESFPKSIVKESRSIGRITNPSTKEIPEGTLKYSGLDEM